MLVFIGIKATPDYESGLDFGSCAIVTSVGFGFFKVLPLFVSIAGWKSRGVMENWLDRRQGWGWGRN